MDRRQCPLALRRSGPTRTVSSFASPSSSLIRLHIDRHAAQLLFALPNPPQLRSVGLSERLLRLRAEGAKEGRTTTASEGIPLPSFWRPR